MTVDAALSNVERQDRMLRFVEQRQRVTVADICDQFGVSVATARRDLEVLAERGSVRRVHGGALAIHRAFDNDRPSRRWPAVLGRSLTLAVVLVGWWMFRCRSWPMMRAMAESLTNLAWHPDDAIIALSLALLMLPVLVIELWQYRRKDLLAPLSLGTWRFACLNAALIAVTFGMWNRFQHGFIYFQF